MSEKQESLSKAFERHSDRLTIVAKVSKDKLKLFLDCLRKPEFSEHSGKVTRDEVVALLGESVERNLLNVDVIDNIVQTLHQGSDVIERRVSKGSSAVEGKDGKIVYLVKPYRPGEKFKDDTFVDLRYLHLFDNIEANTPIARIYPPTSGTPGTDVLGSVITSKPGKEVSITYDDTIEFVPRDEKTSYDTLIAKVAGYLNVEGGKVKIEQQLGISNNVDFQTGNIDFIGGVVVAGNVQRSFKVRARQDIEVKGDVDNGYLESTGAGIVVQGTICGALQIGHVQVAETVDSRMLDEILQERSTHIKANGVVKAQRIQSSSVEAERNIEVEREILNCYLRTKETLLIPHGRLIGGITYTVCGVEALIIGSPRESKTVIHLCSDVESTREYTELLQSLQQCMEVEELLKLQLGPLSEKVERIEKLSEPHYTKMVGLHHKLVAVQKTIDHFHRKQVELLTTAQYNTMFRVNILEKLHRGVEIHAGEKVFIADEEIIGPKSIEYLPETKEFVTTELKPLLCDVTIKKNKQNTEG